MGERARAARLLAGLALRADPRRAVAVTLLTAANAAMGALIAYWLKLFADGVVRADGGDVDIAAVALAATGIVVGVAAWANFAMRTMLVEKTALALDTRLAGLAAGIPGVEHYERPDYHDRLSVLREQREHLSRTVSALVGTVGILVQVVTTAVLLASVHPLLLLLPLAGLPSLLAGGRAAFVNQRGYHESAPRERLARHLFELGTAPAAGKELRVFGLRDEILGRYDAAWADVDRARTRAAIRAAAISAAGWLSFALGYAGAVVFVSLRAAHGDATVGDVLLTVTLAAQVNRQVEGAAYTVEFLARALSLAGRLVWLHDLAERSSARGSAPAPEELREGIAFEGVTFRYPGTDAPVLEDVTLRLPAGATVAVVGDNGAGKSTLVKLIARMYEPTEGRITVDGTDLRDLDVEAWRARLSAGFQDYARFELPAREVVGVGDLARATDEAAVAAALERAGAGPVVAELPQGLDTPLGPSFEDGHELSIGQWQKLALGRAFMRDAPLVLLLDEPTASLDAEAEHELFERYAAGARRTAAATGAITVLVSHRFSTVRSADTIVVISGGRVAETGSHAELTARGGLYAELYDLQASGYREGETEEG